MGDRCHLPRRESVRETFRMTIAIVGKMLFWAWIVSEVLVVVVTRTRGAEGDVQDRGSMLVLVGGDLRRDVLWPID